VSVCVAELVSVSAFLKSLDLPPAPPRCHSVWLRRNRGVRRCTIFPDAKRHGASSPNRQGSILARRDSRLRDCLEILPVCAHAHGWSRGAGVECNDTHAVRYVLPKLGLSDFAQITYTQVALECVLA